MFLGQSFPLAIHVMNEFDKDLRSINWADWHHIISPFCSINTREGDFSLDSKATRI